MCKLNRHVVLSFWWWYYGQLELSLLILVCIHKSFIVYFEISVVPISHRFSFFLVTEKSWKIKFRKEGAPWPTVLEVAVNCNLKSGCFFSHKFWYLSSYIYICVFVCVCWQPVGNADFVIPVEIDGTVHQVTVSLYHLCIIIAIFGLNKFYAAYNYSGTLCTWSVLTICH